MRSKERFTKKDLEELFASDLKEANIKCADCDKLLLKMVRSRQTEEVQELIVNCPFCGGQCWMKELVGKYYQPTPEGLVLGGMEEVRPKSYKLNVEIAND